VILGRSGLATALFFIALPAPAHHSRAIFDQGRIITIEGVVTEYEWANPHVYLYIESQTETGSPVLWTFEGGVTAVMHSQGWSRDSFAPGDHVIVEANPARDSSRNLGLLASAEKAGLALVSRSARVIPAPEPSPSKARSLSGVWAVPGQPLVARFSEPYAWKLTAKGAAARTAYDDRTMNPQIECVSRTAPWVMIFTGAHKIEIGDSIVSIRAEYDALERTVYMDVPSHEGASVSHQGHSIGRWEDGALVVDTTHFEDHRSGNARGVPSGPEKHLVERFAIDPEGTSMSYSFVLEDPEYLAEPVTGELHSTYRPDLDFDPIPCDPENARRYVGK
jgi:hypothetical protein